MFILKIKTLKMIWLKYETMSDVVFIILRPFLLIIYIDWSWVITNYLF